MALIKCSKCGKEISDKSNNCVSCGAPINIKKSVWYARRNNLI